MTAPGGHADPAYLLDSSGPTAPPRDNGELVFAAPWESRAFGLALALNEAGLIDWEDFRRALIREIGDWEAAHPSGEGWSYYECWLRALERTAGARGLVDPGALADRAALLAALPAGHDHERHGHGHERHGHGPVTEERGREPAGGSRGVAPPGQHGHEGHEH
jgi:nitrile hydratase accessory protein